MSNLRGSPAFLLFVLGLSVGAAGPDIRAENIDPDIDDSQYAYGENVGWLNAEPSGNGGPGVEVGDFALTGYMWGENIGWVSLSCTNTSSCGTTDYGVSNDGIGTLSGFAWGENVGWINFAPSTAGVSIDPGTGDFAGRAWAENVGWITFAATSPVAYKVKTDWCQSVAAAPSGTPDIDVAPSGSNTQLSWPALAGADWYEVVQGDLAVLRSTGGDYAAATDQCVADNETATSVLISGTPPAGQGLWFIVRGVNCKGRGTYDSGGPSQAGSRDAGIAGSGNDCP